MKRIFFNFLILFSLVLIATRCGRWDDGIEPKGIAPKVSLTSPINSSTDIPINLKIAATFSKIMDSSTLNSSSFTVFNGTTKIAGKIKYTGLTALFTPSANLAANTLFTATINTGAMDLDANHLAEKFVWSFTTGATALTTPPTISFTAPVNNATGVPLNSKISVNFSQVMDPSTITTKSFTLKAGSTTVSGTVSMFGLAATFTPSANLIANTLYTATVSSDAQDLAGNALASTYTWTFTTGATVALTPPTVSSTVPINGSTGVALNLKPTATFSTVMDPTSITTSTFTLKGPGSTSVLGVVTYAGNIATFAPSSNLAANTLFTATIKGGVNGVKDLAGNALLSDKVWTFTTGAATDTTPPTVLSTNPAAGAIGLCLSKSINATFSEAMDATTITPSSFTVTGPGSTSVVGTVTYDASTKIATFQETSSLAASTLFTATINSGSTGVKDISGNPLATNFSWTFTTGTQACSPQIALGAAATFGTAGGGSGMTNQGLLTVINGDIATTGASTTVTGFHDNGGANSYTETPLNSGNVTGKIYTAAPPPTIGDGSEGTTSTFNIATLAVAAAQNAWSNTLSPAGLPGGTDPGSGQLGGLTLPPGVYASAGGTFLLTGSDLTLDGQGDTNAVWVFQANSSLTVGAPGAPRSVILINGAQAKNVFWRIGSSATINAAGGGTMVGTIIADAGVTFSTAGNVSIVTLNGRALGLHASVTMVNTVINVPAP